MVSPRHGLFEAARVANEAGRRLMALKLATAAAAFAPAGKDTGPRALRIWILAAIGEQNSALEDARVWVKSYQVAPTMALASYAQQLQQSGQAGAAVDVYQQAIEQEPDQHILRARRAELLMVLGREGQALRQTVRVFEHATDNASRAVAVTVAGKLCDSFASQHREDEIQDLLGQVGPNMDQSPKLLGYRALLAAAQGNTSGAKRDLKRARKLNPELPIYEKVERALAPSRGSWWRW